jgi:hypothetical protein
VLGDFKLFVLCLFVLKVNRFMELQRILCSLSELFLSKSSYRLHDLENSYVKYIRQTLCFIVSYWVMSTVLLK